MSKYYYYLRGLKVKMSTNTFKLHMVLVNDWRKHEQCIDSVQTLIL